MSRLRAAAGAALIVLSACGGEELPGAADCAEGREIVRESGLRWIEIACGDGEVSVDGAAVTVNYEGRLGDGRVFDSSRWTGRPFEFVVGAKQVIEGWDEGIRGMREGGTRRLVVPPDLAYGANGFAGVVPPNATLTFDIELLEVRLPED